MNRIAPRSRLALAVALAVGSSLLFLNMEASAAERGRQRSAPRGDHTHVTVKQRTETGHTRSDTWTGADGRTASRNAVVVNDREAGVRTRNAVTTLPDGRTRTVNDVRTKTDDGYTRSTTVVNPNGGTMQRDVTATFDADTKTMTKTVTVDRTPAPAPAPAPTPAP